MDNQFHELFNVAQKVDDMMFPNEDGNIAIIIEDGSTIEVDESLNDFLIGVHTLIEIIQEM